MNGAYVQRVAKVADAIDEGPVERRRQQEDAALGCVVTEIEGAPHDSDNREAHARPGRSR